jgi:signal transduction histidine kinase
VTVQVAAERQRIAGLLHDDVSSLLFAAATTAARATTSNDVDELHSALVRIETDIQEAAGRLREVLRGCAPSAPIEGVPAAAHRDLDDFTERSAIPAHLVVRGHARVLGATTERVVLNCLRQALFNIEQHADAALVVVTLDYAPEEITLVVLDDGLGLPPGYQASPVPESARRWGFASMARQVEQRGGSLELTAAEDGGARLRIRLPG